VVGMGIRGMWAHEGKFLMIVDGIEMNEIQYGSNHFGNEFPVTQIKRVEIIRGPGSAIYGGFAELAVVNIITKKGADLKGANANVTYGRMENTDARKNLALSFGRKSGDWDYSVAGYIGKGMRGDGLYMGTDGGSPATTGYYDMDKADEVNPGMINAGVSGHGLNIRFLREQYEMTTRSMYGFTAFDKNIPNTFSSNNILVSYDFVPVSNVKITPQVQFNQQLPWEQTTEEARLTAKSYKITSERLKSGLTASVDFTPQLNFLGGFEYISDKNHIDEQLDDTNAHVPFVKTGTDDADFDSRAYIAQVLYNTDLFTAVAGARYESPGFTKSSFVPRFGVTKAEKTWHAKALYAEAFRSPSLQNINNDPDPIRPEKTKTYEVEAGTATTGNSYLTANIFVTQIKDPIVYYYTTGDQYANFGEVGTSGAELDWRWKMKGGQVQLGYSYYTVNHSNVSTYKVTDHDDALLGMAQHKAVINAWMDTGLLGWRLNPSLNFIGKTYGYEYSDESAAMELHAESERWLANLYFSNANLGLKGLEVGFGIFNLLDQRNRYIQPYTFDTAQTSGHSPVPGPSREFMARIDYSLNF
jgi:outer membrane cobalamin receptor